MVLRNIVFGRGLCFFRNVIINLFIIISFVMISIDYSFGFGFIRIEVVLVFFLVRRFEFFIFL